MPVTIDNKFVDKDSDDPSNFLRFWDRARLVTRFDRMCEALGVYVQFLTEPQKVARGIFIAEDEESFETEVWKWWANMHITDEYPRCYDFDCGHNVTYGIFEKARLEGKKPEELGKPGDGGILNRVGFCTCPKQFYDCGKRVPIRERYFETGKPFSSEDFLNH